MLFGVVGYTMIPFVMFCAAFCFQSNGHSRCGALVDICLLFYRLWFVAVFFYRRRTRDFAFEKFGCVCCCSFHLRSKKERGQSAVDARHLNSRQMLIVLGFAIWLGIFLMFLVFEV